MSTTLATGIEDFPPTMIFGRLFFDSLQYPFYSFRSDFELVAIDSSIASVFPETLLCYVSQTNNVKILSAIPGAPSMNKEEVGKFLESKLLLQIGTIDDEGDPNIQPVWFDYDKGRDKLLIITPKAAKKVRNLRSKPNVYFSVDDENFPYKGVKGKGTAAIIEDPKRTVPLGEKINMKYLGTLDHPIPMMILDSAKKGNHVVVEISPKFFSTWDFAKIQ